MSEQKESLIELPDGFEVTDYFINYEAGDTILWFCRTCTKKTGCEHQKYLRQAMGENFPFWSKKFILVKCYPDKKVPFYPKDTTFCEDYESFQTKLPFPSFSDGVLKLIEYINEMYDDKDEEETNE